MELRRKFHRDQIRNRPEWRYLNIHVDTERPKCGASRGMRMCGKRQQGQVWQNALTHPHAHTPTHMAR